VRARNGRSRYDIQGFVPCRSRQGRQGVWIPIALQAMAKMGVFQPECFLAVLEHKLKSSNLVRALTSTTRPFRGTYGNATLWARKSGSCCRCLFTREGSTRACKSEQNHLSVCVIDPSPAFREKLKDIAPTEICRVDPPRIGRAISHF
jgi:hypothetical protein